MFSSIITNERRFVQNDRTHRKKFTWNHTVETLPTKENLDWSFI